MNRILTTILVAMALGKGATCATIKYANNGAVCTSCTSPQVENISAIITTSTDTITVVLDNLLANPTADTQGISGLAFVLDIVDNNTPTFSSQVGQLITIASDGTWSNAGGAIDHWQVTNTGVTASNTSINMDTLVAAGQKSNLVIGDPAANNVYSAANNSIAGKFNPWIKNEGSFVIHLVGVTVNTHVTSATFNVGTATGQGVNASVAVPEPGSWTLLSLAAIPCWFRMRRRQRS